MSNAVAGIPGKDPTLPDVPLILGGKVRQLCFDYAAIVHVDKLTGLNLLKESVSMPTFYTLGALLWACLLRDDPETTFEGVAPLITPQNAPAIHAAVLTAWYKSTPDPDPAAKAGAKGKRKARATTSA